MTRGTVSVLVVTLSLAAAAAPAPGTAQGWTVDLYAGGTRAQGVAAQVTSTSLVGNLRHQWTSGPVAYLALGAPLGDGALWGSAGVGGRVQRALTGPLAYGLEFGTDAFAYRHDLTDTSGQGGSVRALPLVALTLPGTGGAGSVELRAGAHGRYFEGSRGLWEVAGRVGTAGQDAGLIADARWLRADTTSYPFVGAQAVRTFGIVRTWASAGRWLGNLDQTAWELGGSVTLGSQGELWASFHEDATDPLYDNPARRSWNVGFSRALGRPRSRLSAPVASQGRVRITLDEDALPGDGGAPLRVAGEFNRWMPAPMTRAGESWVLELPLPAGVYRFSFVTAGGRWFVPEGYPGRTSDDMGGHVAVLVVQ